MARRPLCLAYYCSGHGYGHATRVSAFARHLLSVDEANRPVIYIVSSAPEHVFADSIACGARYRFAEIDPVIVQPLAYRVDRRKSVEILKKFLDKKDELLERERQWLLEVQAHSVLSDAAFLGCGSALRLITNFSFDSVYSYLSTPLRDITPPHLAPLVDQIHAGYRHIPMPSFFVSPPLPSFEWVDCAPMSLLFCRAAVASSVRRPNKVLKRRVVQAPLLSSVYTPEGRARLLSSIGIPPALHDPAKTKILVVSFGGQVFRRPGSSRASRNSSHEDITSLMNPHPRAHDYLASKPLLSPSASIQPSTLIVPQIHTIPPTPAGAFEFDEIEDVPQLLPDASWIAIVCGVSKAQWSSQRDGQDSELPAGFFVAPRDVYMPDLTAVGDVLLGKLGYGTVSECVDACTPFVYVSRPLFIEEHGLRLLLDQEGTGVELAREAYEAGDWAAAVSEAFAKGKKAKDRKRDDMARGIDVDKREAEGRKLAGTVTEWVWEWWRD
ncbi:hypothetical protein BJ912DRAFT_949874 [Pholiota molesta]|nr:hypothetical protein BJ912DRAFT_949874 [Pholiota molesta]